MNDDFEKLCSVINISTLPKIDAAICFLWFHQRILGYTEADINTINIYFTNAHLPQFPHSRLRNQFTKDSRVTKGSDKYNYKLKRPTLESLDQKYENYFHTEEILIHERANLSETPFLDANDISKAHKMAELYIIAHCYENSARRFIESILTTEIGTNWWEIIKNKDLNDKFTSRKNKEDKEKWVNSRGIGSPLYYLDWTDLVKIIRKEEKRFIPYVNDIQWVEMRFEELGRVRNVIAHNGVIVSDDEIDRVILYFKDWYKQLSALRLPQGVF